MTVLIVEPGALPRRAEIGTSLRAMQAVVGGPIQAVYPFDEPVALVCHEEGKLLGLDPNRPLTDSAGRVYDLIAGTFFLCAAPPDSDSFAGLTEEQLERYSKHFRSPVCLIGGVFHG